jgi:hypothetical protein
MAAEAALTGGIDKMASKIGAWPKVALSLAKGIFGAVQTAKANKQIKSLLANPITYKRPEEYLKELAMRKSMASQTEMPGMGYKQDSMNQLLSQTLSSAKEGAISSNVYQKSVGDAFQKAINSLRQDSYDNAQWQQQQKENLIGTLGKGAGYSDQEFTTNVQQPWDIKMNMAQSNKQSGATNLWGGVEGLAATATDYAGTKYYQDIIKGLQEGKA